MKTSNYCEITNYNNLAKNVTNHTRGHPLSIIYALFLQNIN